MKRLFSVICVFMLATSGLILSIPSNIGNDIDDQVENLALGEVLLIDGDSNLNGWGTIVYYETALNNIGANYTIWDIVALGKPTAADMDPYDVVIWVPDKDMNWGAPPYFNSADEAEVATYLDGGGNFLLSNIAWTDYTDAGSYIYSAGDFAYDYMGLTSVNGFSGNEFGLNGTIGDPVYGGFGPIPAFDWFQGGWGGFAPWASDDIFGITPGCTIGLWNDDGAGSSEACGVYNDGGTFRTAFWGFPFEVVPQPWADDLMNRTLTWFSTTPGVPQMTLSKSAPATAHP